MRNCQVGTVNGERCKFDVAAIKGILKFRRFRKLGISFSSSFEAFKETEIKLTDSI